MQIAGNTIHAYVGDAIHLSGGAYNIEIISNILWADTGYDLYVANDSQTGFWSDYNTLYSTGAGKLVYWTKDFTDILDWQDDVDQFDLHSVGVTVVNPNWAEPHFGVDANGFEITRPLVGGARPSDPTIDGGDPAGSFIGYKGTANLLADGNFESPLDPAANWTYTAGGSIVSNALTPFESTAEFQSGAAATPSSSRRSISAPTPPRSTPGRCKSPSGDRSLFSPPPRGRRSPSSSSTQATTRSATRSSFPRARP